MKKMDQEQRLKEWSKPNINGYITNSNGGCIHRDIWVKHHGEIPKGYVIHHKDRNKLNNDINNLQMLSWSDHIKEHRKQKKFSL